jgi:NAD(P)-dependent dehydrogenase (short-subunit alcohol dehydrogenase family)
MPSLKELSNMSGRTVLITGGVGHLGRVMADALAELGASIILLDRPGSDFSGVKNGLEKNWGVECFSIECDLEFEEQRSAAISQIRALGCGVNCLVNNAAFVGTTQLEGWAAPFEHQSLDAWRRAMEINLTSAFHLSQALLPELAAAKGANIVNITSIYGEIGPDWRLYEGTGMGNPAAYAASKGGLAQLTRWLATTLAPSIRVNTIAPGGLLRDQLANFVNRYTAMTPLRRMATEADLKGAIAFLASDLSAYVTGETIKIDGGWAAW